METVTCNCNKKIFSVVTIAHTFNVELRIK